MALVPLNVAWSFLRLDLIACEASACSLPVDKARLALAHIEPLLQSHIDLWRGKDEPLMASRARMTMGAYVNGNLPRDEPRLYHWYSLLPCRGLWQLSDHQRLSAETASIEETQDQRIPKKRPLARSSTRSAIDQRIPNERPVTRSSTRSAMKAAHPKQKGTVGAPKAPTSTILKPKDRTVDPINMWEVLNIGHHSISPKVACMMCLARGIGLSCRFRGRDRPCNNCTAGENNPCSFLVDDIRDANTADEVLFVGSNTTSHIRDLVTDCRISRTQEAAILSSFQRQQAFTLRREQQLFHTLRTVFQQRGVHAAKCFQDDEVIERLVAAFYELDFACCRDTPIAPGGLPSAQQLISALPADFIAQYPDLAFLANAHADLGVETDFKMKEEATATEEVVHPASSRSSRSKKGRTSRRS